MTLRLVQCGHVPVWTEQVWGLWSTPGYNEGKRDPLPMTDRVPKTNVRSALTNLRRDDWNATPPMTTSRILEDEAWVGTVCGGGITEATGTLDRGGL